MFDKNKPFKKLKQESVKLDCFLEGLNEEVYDFSNFDKSIKSALRQMRRDLDTRGTDRFVLKPQKPIKMNRTYYIIDKELEQLYIISVSANQEEVSLNRVLVVITFPHKETRKKGTRFHTILGTRFDESFKYPNVDELLKDLNNSLGEIKEENPSSDLAKSIVEVPNNLEGKRQEANRSIMRDRMSRR